MSGSRAASNNVAEAAPAATAAHFEESAAAGLQTEHPVPPYDADTDFTNKVQCYYPECKYKGGSWGKVLTHVRNSHKCPTASLKGTPLYEHGQQELMSKQRDQYHAKKARTTDSPSKPKGDMVPKQEIAPGRKSAPDEIVQEHKEVADGMWKIMPCYVKCTPDGNPVQPFHIIGPIDLVSKPQSMQLAHMEAESTLHKTNIQAPTENAIMPAQAANAIAESVQQKPPAPTNPSPSDMLLHLYQKSRAEPDAKEWLLNLPVVEIKQNYVDHARVPAKGELVAGEICKRAVWPPKLKQDSVQLPEFYKFLVNDQNMKSDWAKTKCHFAGRLLGALECTNGTLVGIEALVAMYTSGTIKKLFSIALMDPKYSWPLDMIDSMYSYICFHLHLMTDKTLTSEPGPWVQYKQVLDAFKSYLDSGVRKKCVEAAALMQAQKQRDDLEAIKKLPPIADLQAAVGKAYKCIQQICKDFGDQPLPSQVRAQLNACLVFAISIDTFAGRKKEWEVLKFQHVVDQLNKNLDYIICSDHKTAATYGDIAKWLSPGLVEAFKLVVKLHRPEGCTTFLVPPQGASHVCFPTCLHTACKRFLNPKKNWPTVNLLRKWFHTKLIKLSRKEATLKHIMTKVDAHSSAVQERHYILKDPADHVWLAKLIFEAIMKQAVDWPSKCEVDEKEELDNWNIDAVEILQDKKEEGEEGEPEEDDLPGWELGHLFGCQTIEKSEAIPLQDAVPDLPAIVSSSSSGTTLQKEEQKAAIVPSDNDTMHGKASVPIASKRKKIESPQHHGKKVKTKEGAASSSVDPDPAATPKQASGNDTVSETMFQEALLDMAEEQAALWREYTEEPIPGTRQSVSNLASEWMMNQLKTWQVLNSKGKWELPADNAWYYNARVECIRAGHINKMTSQDVVRSHLRNKIRKCKAQDTAELQEPLADLEPLD